MFVQKCYLNALRTQLTDARRVDLEPFLSITSWIDSCRVHFICAFPAVSGETLIKFYANYATAAVVANHRVLRKRNRGSSVKILTPLETE